MTETAGWGVPGFLPPRVARRMLQDDAREALAARQAEQEREQRAEERHSRAMTLYREQAEARGEEFSALALATGQVRGRSVQDILAAASAAADRDDMITEARLHREGHGDPEPLHVFVDEPVLAGRSVTPTGRAIATRARRFRAVLDARRQLAAAERAAEASKHDHGLIPGVTQRTREDNDPVVAISPSRRRGGPVPDNGLRFR